MLYLLELAIGSESHPSLGFNYEHISEPEIFTIFNFCTRKIPELTIVTKMFPSL